MPKVACLSCGAEDGVQDVESITPEGDWVCDGCGWHVAKIVTRSWS